MTTPHSSTPLARHFGAWDSPITTGLIVGDSVSLDQVAIDGDNIYWIEGRAREQGRCVLVRHHDGACEDVLPAPWNVRTRVHEYGGGAYLVKDGRAYFSQFNDQRLWRSAAAPGAQTEPQALTSASLRRHADYAADPLHERLFAVCEDHASADAEATNRVVAIDLHGGDDVTLIEGSDFYASPRPSPDGRTLAWLSWNHPDMPWDGTFLQVADLRADGSLGTARPVAGGRRESIFQPAWSPAGELHFVSDRSGWWNLYRLREGIVEALQPMAAEFGRAQWNFGVCTYGFEADGNLICSYAQDGNWRLARLNAVSLAMTDIALPFRNISDVRVGNGFAVFIGGAPDTVNAVVRLDLRSGQWRILRRAIDLTIDPAYLSTPQAIRFPTTNGLQAHAFFYAPTNRDFCGLPGQRPPLLTISHGGPTSTASATLNLSIQYWTSRGFAVVDVNYGGSTGYGRAYRERLYGQWGVVDVDDAIAAARYLVARGDVDGEQIAIRGSSAGGYTTLAALTFHDVFKAGASYYGVSDLEALARDCHKFESRYLDHLVGAYPAEQARYRARSPIHFTERLSAPLILFQGLDDKVVPPNQSQAMFDALNEKGLPVAYITFAGESHGFRRAENIQRALEAELYFYAKVFGFAEDAATPAVDIMNLP